MAALDENRPGVIGPVNAHEGMKQVVIGQNRRALCTIDRNIIGNKPCASALNKRNGFPEKHSTCNKNPPIPVHRPITRKLAAQIASKKQQETIIEEAKKPVKWLPGTAGLKDYGIIDLEDCNAASDPVPMYVLHTEAMMDEIDQMDEEMDMDYIDEEDPIIDIDSGDTRNPLAIVEYVDDIYAYYKKAEISSCVPTNYMTRQSDLNEKMRAILIDWLIEVHYKFELMDETLYLTVNLIDRFLSVQQVLRKKLQLVGVTALLLACKYEEVSVPVVEDLILISDKAYTRKEVLEMETLIVNKLQFNMSVPTPYVFMRRFLKAAQSNRRMELLAFYIIELCLVEYEMVKFTPSFLAAAAIFTAQSTLIGLKDWSLTLEKHANYTVDQLLDCSKMMVGFHQSAGKGKLTGVYRKYNTSRYGYAAKSQPARFLLEDRF